MKRFITYDAKGEVQRSEENKNTTSEGMKTNRNQRHDRENIYVKNSFGFSQCQ